VPDRVAAANVRSATGAPVLGDCARRLRLARLRRAIAPSLPPNPMRHPMRHPMPARPAACPWALEGGELAVASAALGSRAAKCSLAPSLPSNSVRHPMPARPAARPWALEGSELAVASAALDSQAARRSPNEVLVVVRNEPLSRRTMSRLRPGEWLSDELVNGYLGLLAESCAAGGGAAGGVHVMSTFFFAKLNSSPSGYNYEGVRRWTKNVDLCACSLVLVPVNLGDSHWILAQLDMQRKHIEVWDSLHHQHPQCVRVLSQYMADEWLARRGKRVQVTAAHCDGAPLQRNGSDCGVFVCAFARCLALGTVVDVSQAVMPDFRMRMSFELLQRALTLRECEARARATPGSGSISVPREKRLPGRRKVRRHH